MLHDFSLNGNSARIGSLAMDICEQIISEIGAELHDDLIQKLSILRLHLDKIERSEFDPAETREIVIRMQADFDEIINTVRRISKRMHLERSLGDSFLDSVATMCQSMEGSRGTRVKFSSDGAPRPLPPRTENFLLRMVQELVQNALKHSAAWHVLVKMEWTKDGLQIQVEDDGTGFARVEECISTLSTKYNTLRMRAEAIGAKITYKPGTSGLLATISVPG